MSESTARPAPFEATACACVILAAGGSRRLGQPKQLVTIDGRALIIHTVETALAVPDLWPVVVVLGGAADRVRPLLAKYPVLVTDNPAWEEGVASSLRAGLTTVNEFSRQIGSVLFTLCDQPALSSPALQALWAVRRQTGKSVVAASYGGHPGAPALIDRKHFGALAHLTGDEGARRLIKSLPPDQLGLVERPELALDIDTPEDLARL
ncbi:nucleotidyltransferase family protein [Synoicihabitans lomoniglobus]|uniref:Nucleotidyltransferase family protein n=1 Tax=Synoicihabitans lomoniglobus TaxID=2909285 RepID=A0AAF0A023_9BACT|nr:nucleotidyltransferase family protein [Opitutaceae bacterium LMO-M01]WED63922.1 nucleotidyltransferase family protein [Opitutaceae bacterium LMO-M01]